MDYGPTLMSAVIIIPARYASERFPGKPLALILGKPMVQWVWEAAQGAKLASAVIIATDDPQIQPYLWNGSSRGGRQSTVRPSDHKLTR